MVFIKLHDPIIDNRPLLMIKTFILFGVPIITYQSTFMSFWFFLFKNKNGKAYICYTTKNTKVLYT
jgi:hypothetical protein